MAKIYQVQLCTIPIGMDWQFRYELYSADHQFSGWVWFLQANVVGIPQQIAANGSWFQSTINYVHG